MVGHGQTTKLGHLLILALEAQVLWIIPSGISSVEFMEYTKYFSVGNITTYSDHCLLSINLALNDVSQASLYKLYLQTVILIDNEISQDTETYLKLKLIHLLVRQPVLTYKMSMLNLANY